MDALPVIHYFGDRDKALTLKGRALSHYNRVLNSMGNTLTANRTDEFNDGIVVNHIINTDAYGNKTGSIRVFVPVDGGDGVDGIYVTSRPYDDSGTSIYIDPFNPKFKAGWDAIDRYWFNEDKGLCVSSANSDVIASFQVQGKVIVAGETQVLHSALPAKGLIVFANFERSLIGSASIFKFTVCSYDNDGVLTILESYDMGYLYVPAPSRTFAKSQGAFSQSTKKMWWIDYLKNFKETTFSARDTINGFNDHYGKFSHSSVLDSVPSSYSGSTIGDVIYFNLNECGEHIEALYVYRDTVTVLTSTIDELNESLTKPNGTFDNPRSGVSTRKTSFKIYRYKKGVLSLKKTFAGLDEHWNTVDDVGTYSMSRTYFIYMNAEIDLYVVMTAAISGVKTSSHDFPATQHIKITVISKGVDTVIFDKTLPFEINSAVYPEFIFPDPTHIDDTSKPAAVEVTGSNRSTGLVFYREKLVSYYPMPNISQSVFDGKTVLCNFYACFFNDLLFFNKQYLAYPKTLIIKTGTLEYELYDYRIDSPFIESAVDAIGFTHTGKGFSTTSYPK